MDEGADKRTNGVEIDVECLPTDGDRSEPERVVAIGEALSSSRSLLLRAVRGVFPRGIDQIKSDRSAYGRRVAN
jgi:hypothetical protein